MSRRLLLFAVLFALVAAAIVWDRANLGFIRGDAQRPPDDVAARTADDPDEIVLVIGGSHGASDAADAATPPVRPAPRATPPPRREPAPGSAPPARASERRVRVEPGETLRAIAARELGDPALWKALAERNGISDPRRLRTGDEIVIPEGASAAASPASR